MGNIKKPMLACNISNIDDIQYPILCSQKIDGIRACVVDGVCVTRNFKPFPNLYIRNLISKLPEGFDGEVIVKNKKFNEITHEVMSEDGEPNFTYCVFDYVKESPDIVYSIRMVDLIKCKVPSFVEKVLPTLINNKKELLAFEKKCLADGYEGCMLRLPSGKYKFGRSTCTEALLLKMKRFSDSECIVLNLNEQMKNTNVKTKDVFGDSKRSSELAGMIPAGTLGAFEVRDIKSGVEFSIGTGMDSAFRDVVWKHKKEWIGKIIKYKSQKSGAKDKPRFPVYLGERSKADMSE